VLQPTTSAGATIWSRTNAYNTGGQLITDTVSSSGGTVTFGRDPLEQALSRELIVHGKPIGSNKKPKLKAAMPAETGTMNSPPTRIAHKVL